MKERLFIRENAPDYIPLSECDEAEMLSSIGLDCADSIYRHIDSRFLLPKTRLGKGKPAEETLSMLREISEKNRKFKHFFLGDSLPVWRVEKIAAEVSNMRGLSTAYTPYQPERSQGTLVTHWLYQCAMSALTGFEAVNCSLYDRATAIFEAVACAARLTKKSTAVLSSSLLPNDIEVVKTLAAETPLKIVVADSIGDALGEYPDAACTVYPQVSNVGTLNDVDFVADLCAQKKVKFIAVVDPMLLGDGGLKPPSKFGENGADIVVGEAQHLSSMPNFGGPGLGLLAVRFNEKNKNDIRQSAGRFVGKAKDLSGRDALAMVLATREQHIRREKATSNICSNQAFMATLAGACILQKGDSGMRASLEKSRRLAVSAFSKITALEGFDYPFGDSPFFNEFCLSVPVDVRRLIAEASEEGIALGVDASGRAGEKNLLKISFSDINSEEDADALAAFLSKYSQGTRTGLAAPRIPLSLSRKDPPKIPSFSFETLKSYYASLADLNVSPDSACYPLGSCTMKYNPLLLDAAASLEGFAASHPQSPEKDVQGSLEVLWLMSEAVKAMTNLDDVALQPVAGAQGELCGIKMIQAYHRDNSNTVRDIILIPASAHGTNFATAAMAGFKPENIVHIPAADNGRLDIGALRAEVEKYGSRVAAIMVTNPNTSGIFETGFKEIADIVHSVGGLVYMDGANYNAIAGRVDLKALGVDAMHNNIHKTWAVSHGGGGPGDGFVAVDKKLSDYIPAYRIIKENDCFRIERPKKSIGSLHRDFGNFAHKIRALAYITRLGNEGVRRMSATAVLSARYLFERLKKRWNTLPAGADAEPRMHEFILTLTENAFAALESAGVNRQSATARAGKLFLDFGFHAPTVAFPEVFGLMIEPTESYGKDELDRFADAVLAVLKLAEENPQAVAKAPRYTPVDRIDEVAANRNPILSEPVSELPNVPKNRLSPKALGEMDIEKITKMIALD